MLLGMPDGLLDGVSDGLVDGFTLGLLDGFDEGWLDFFMDGVADSFVLGPFDSCNSVVDRRKDSELVTLPHGKFDGDRDIFDFSNEGESEMRSKSCTDAQLLNIIVYSIPLLWSNDSYSKFCSLKEKMLAPALPNNITNL